MQAPMTFDADNYYFSGQGVVMIGARDPITGRPQGLKPVGNVSELKITVATTVVDHKGSQDGQRAIDKRLQTETKATASITIDNWIAKNLANALRGFQTIIPAGVVTDEVFSAGPGLVSGLDFIKVSEVVISTTTATPVPLIPWVDDLTAWDYKVNLAAGSIMLNDSSKVASINLGGKVTAVTVGPTTLLTIANNAVPGDEIQLSGFTGVDAGLLNGQSATVLSATPTEVTVDILSTGKVITSTTYAVGPPVIPASTAFFPNNPLQLSAAYSYGTQYKVDTLTQPLTDTWLRFEGLNTAAENSPVIVDLFKFETDPLKELALISDTFGAFVMEGALLSDSTRPPGTSKYFSVKMVGTAN